MPYLPPGMTQEQLRVKPIRLTPAGLRPGTKQKRIHTNAARMLDHCVTVLGIKSYANLARVLDIDPSQLSKMRSGKYPVWNTVLLALHELTGIPIARLKDLAGIKECVRPYYQK